MPDDRHYPNATQDRPQVQTARQAAEALFRPKPQVAPAEAPTLPAATSPTSTEPNAPRKPRIFCATPANDPPAHEPKAPVGSAAQQGTDTRRKVQKIPKSAHGRIKILTTHGMTVEDVAELYGVPVSDIARIVSTAM